MSNDRTREIDRDIINMNACITHLSDPTRFHFVPNKQKVHDVICYYIKEIEKHADET